MAIAPLSTLLVFTNSASSSVNIWANEISRAKIVEPFQRAEFSNQRRREVKNSLGGLPMIVNNIANLPLQLSVSCAGDSPRPLLPDDANLSSINQQFNIQRYTIQGAPTPVANLAVVEAQAIVHAGYLQKFQYHQTSVGSDISFSLLTGSLSSENFSYLTTTGVSIAGDALGGTATQMLITSFNQDVAYSSTQADGTVVNLATWSMTIENRTISSQASN
jgi:hypothetical protein